MPTQMQLALRIGEEGSPQEEDAAGSAVEEPEAEPKWVLVKTFINPFEQLFAIGSRNEDGTVSGIFRESEVATNPEVDTATISHHIVNAYRDRGTVVEAWDITYTFIFDTPPAELVPGDPLNFGVTGTASGTILEGAGTFPTVFQYSGPNPCPMTSTTGTYLQTNVSLRQSNRRSPTALLVAVLRIVIAKL